MEADLLQRRISNTIASAKGELWINMRSRAGTDASATVPLVAPALSRYFVHGFESVALTQDWT